MMRIYLDNQTPYTLKRINYNDTHGKWGTKPTKLIEENSNKRIATAHDTSIGLNFAIKGAEVWATYKIIETGDIVHWRAQTNGKNKCDFRFDENNDLLKLSSDIGSSGDPDVHLTIKMTMQ